MTDPRGERASGAVVTAASLPDRYTLLTQEVLVSVRKMEDSLKRLKRARDRTPVPEGAASDDDKIRLQLCLDVQHFGAQVGQPPFAGGPSLFRPRVHGPVGLLRRSDSEVFTGY